MASCSFGNLVSKLLDEELTTEDVSLVENHLCECSECQEFCSFHQDVDKSIAQYLFVDQEHRILDVDHAKDIGFSQEVIEAIQQKQPATIKKIVTLLYKARNRIKGKQQLTKVERKSEEIIDIAINIILAIGTTAPVSWGIWGIYKFYLMMTGKNVKKPITKTLSKKEKKAILYDMWGIAYIISQTSSKEEISKAYDKIAGIQQRVLVA